MKNLYDEFYGLIGNLSAGSKAYTEEAAKGFGYLIEDFSTALSEGDQSIEGLTGLLYDLCYNEDESTMRDKE